MRSVEFKRWSLDCRRVIAVSLASAFAAGGLALGTHTAIGAPATPVAVPSPLSLDNAVAIALRNAPTIEAAKAQVAQADALKQQAQAGYYPSVTPKYSYQNRRQTLGSGNSTLNGSGLSVTLTQTLYDGGLTEANNAQARRLVDATQFSQTDSRQALILSVTSGYYDLLAAIDQVKVAKAQVARYKAALDVTQGLVTAGVTAAKEVNQSQADLANAQVTLVQYENNARIASINLKSIMGVEVDGDIQPVAISNTDTLPTVPVPTALQPVAECVAIAYANRADLSSQKATLENKRIAVNLANREAGVTVNGGYSLGYQATNDIGPTGTDSLLAISASYPLFDGGYVRAKVRSSKADVDYAAAQLRQIRLQVRNEVETAYANRSTALTAVTLSQAAVKAAQVNYDAALAAQRLGAGVALDVTTSQATLTQAQVQYVNSVYTYYIADAQLSRAVGMNEASRP
ncbi:MAG TPA: TolC family protein [Capsulimonadaceae bacterium]|jgi:outer membrane protein